MITDAQAQQLQDMNKRMDEEDKSIQAMSTRQFLELNKSIQTQHVAFENIDEIQQIANKSKEIDMRTQELYNDKKSQMKREYITDQTQQIAMEILKIAEQRQQIALERQRIAFEREQIAIHRQQIAMNIKQIAIHREQIAMNREQITIEGQQIANQTQQILNEQLQTKNKK